jgi:hypothetical protein
VRAKGLSLVVVSLVAAFGMVLAVPASAASPKHPPLPPPPPMTGDAPGVAPAASVLLQGGGAGLPFINCILAADSVHGSHHVNGTMNVTARVGCNLAVPWLCIEAWIWSDNRQQYISDSGCVVFWPNKTGGTTNAPAPFCETGWYIGLGYADVIYPINYIPQERTLYVWSTNGWTYITKGIDC